MLTEDHEVWLASLRGKREPVDDLLGLRLAGSTFITLRRTLGCARTVGALMTGDSLQSAFVAEPRMSRAISEIVDEWEPNVAHFNVIRSAAFLDSVGSVEVMFDLDEIRSDYYRQLQSSSTSFKWRAISRLEAPRLSLLESRVAVRSAQRLFSSPADLDRLTQESHLVRSPAPFTYDTANNRPGQPPSLLFVGRMTYRANVEALAWFVDNVFQPLRAAHGNVVLQVVGEGSAEMGRGRFGVEHLGEVGDLSPYYQNATACVVPVAFGTGVQMKLIQALTAGRPTITNPECARRAGVTSDQVVVASTPDDWVQGLLQILENPDTAEALALEGHRWAEHHYSWRQIKDSLLNAYRSLA